MPASLDPSAHLLQPADRETLVSVVLPTFNRAALLPDAIRSVLSQSWQDSEVIVVDDGSQDGTEAVVRQLAASDPRVRYLPQPNRGVSAARNRALACSRGAMIAFLDSDDIWLPGKLQAQVDVLQALPSVGMVWTDMRAIALDGRQLCDRYLRTMYKGYDRVSERTLFSSTATLRQLAPNSPLDGPVAWGRIYSQMLFGNLVHTPTVLMRREWAAQVGPFDPSIRAGGEDYKYHLATTRLCDVALLDVPTIDYRIGGDDQITNLRNQVNFATSFLRTLDEHVAQHREEILLSDDELTTIRAGAYDWLASALVESGQRRPAARNALRAIRQRPALPTAWKTLMKTLLPRSAVDLVRAARRIRSGSTAATM